MAVTNVAELNALVERVKKAQREYASFTQEQVDKIFRAAALAAAPPGDGDGPVSGRRDRRPGLQPYTGRAAPHPHGHGRHAGSGGAAGRRLLGHLFAA